MFRSRTPRSAVAAALSIALIAAFMVGTTSAASSQQGSDRAAAAAPKPKPSPTPTPTPIPTPTPTPPNSDNRTVYFGWPTIGGDRQLQPSEVTTGNVFAFDVIARNDDNQNLTHPRLAFGGTTEPGGPSANGLPDGATIIDVETSGVACVTEVLADDGKSYSCDLPSFKPDDFIQAKFTVQAGNTAIPNGTILWASFKVSEKVSNVGANQNTAFASAPMTIMPTTSNANATYKVGGQNEPFELSTGGTPVAGDPMTTSVKVPNNVDAGAISISEVNCDKTCHGQIATVHVRDGSDQSPYLEWTLKVVASLNNPVVKHELDNGTVEQFSGSCTGATDTNCIVDVTKSGNVTTIVFRTLANGRIRV